MDKILGWLATILFTLMLFPQIIKTWKCQDISGVSPFCFLVYLFANVIALIYSSLINQPPLIIKYSVAIVLSIIYLFIYFKVKKNVDNL